MKYGACNIVSFKKDQIEYLFSQAYPANMAMLAAAVLVIFSLTYQGEVQHISWFFAVFLGCFSARMLLLRRFNKKDRTTSYQQYANYYVLTSLLLGLDWALLSFAYYDLNNDELRFFLTIVNLGLITAAVGSLSMWMKAYIAFSLPQILSLMVINALNNNLLVTVSLFIFSWFMFVIARNTNLKFKQGRQLIRQNIKLIDKMETEIQNRKKAQLNLEQAQEVLEDLVKERTSELLEANLDLKEQIDKRCEVEKDLHHLAYYDVLTGLPNRVMLIERLKAAVIKAQKNDTLFAVLFVDLDRFKAINDSLGHAVGDQLIQQVSVRLKNALREDDVIARNGGDEFVIILEKMSDVRSAFVVAEKLIACTAALFEINGHDVHIGTSIGIATYPIDGIDALDLLKMADTAMYYAKDVGSNSFEFYSSEMSNRIKGRLELENALRLAVENEDFYLVFQPQCDIHSNATTGFEALIRWNSAEFGQVSPAVFVPVLEETGMIYVVGDWVIKEVLQFIKSGKARNAKVSINLSALQCGVNQYSEKIKKYIDQSNVNPAQIEFEITESVLIKDFNKTEAFLNSIHELGCTIALDDFGSGYTSFKYLAKLPIDIIKIDRSVISGIDHKKNLQDIVKAIVTMCRGLAIDNVFEGVESEKELETVRRLGAKTVQGFYFSKPLRLDAIAPWFGDDHKRNNLEKNEVNNEI